MTLHLKYKLNSPDAPSFEVIPEGDPVVAFSMGHEAALAGFKSKVYSLDPADPSTFALKYETPMEESEPVASRRGARAEA